MRKGSLTNFERVRRPRRGIFVFLPSTKPPPGETSETFLGEDESEIIIKFMGFRRSKFSFVRPVSSGGVVVETG